MVEASRLTMEGEMRTEKMRCPVCRGLGFKGHGLWNILTDCYACDGTGKVEVHKRSKKPDLWVDFVRQEARS